MENILKMFQERTMQEENTKDTIGAIDFTNTIQVGNADIVHQELEIAFPVNDGICKSICNTL